MKTLPKIIVSGAHNSNVIVLSPSITQWYTNDSLIVQFCRSANTLHFFLLAALFQSSFEVGQNSTFVALFTAS